MSELVQSIQAKFPERCRTCPLRIALVAIVESQEKAAARNGAEVAKHLDEDARNPNYVSKELAKRHAIYLGWNTELEGKAIRGLTHLSDGAEECPGDPNADELYIFPRSLEILTFVGADLICQNPNLEQAAAAITPE